MRLRLFPYFFLRVYVPAFHDNSADNFYILQLKIVTR